MDLTDNKGAVTWHLHRRWMSLPISDDGSAWMTELNSADSGPTDIHAAPDSALHLVFVDSRLRQAQRPRRSDSSSPLSAARL